MRVEYDGMLRADIPVSVAGGLSALLGDVVAEYRNVVFLPIDQVK